jgi:hypothetical protein
VSNTNAADERERLTALGWLAALSLDALSSVAYGPEAILVVLVTAGAAALEYTLPITGAIVVLLAALRRTGVAVPGRLAIITGANMWGVVEPARIFAVPTLAFIADPAVGCGAARCPAGCGTGCGRSPTPVIMRLPGNNATTPDVDRWQNIRYGLLCGDQVVTR